MADFVAVLRRTIDNLGENTPEMREKVFEKARATIDAKLAALDPQPPAAVADRQRKALENAVAVVRAEYDTQEQEADADDLEDIFSSLTAPAAPLPAAEAPQPAIVDGDDDRAEPEPDSEPASEPRAEPGGIAAEPRAEDPPFDDPEAAQADAGGKEPEHDDDWHESVFGVPAAEPSEASPADDPARPHAMSRDPVLDDAAAPGGEPPARKEPAPVPAGGTARGSRRRRIGGGLIAAVIALMVIAAGGYGLWLNRDDLGTLFDMGGPPAEEIAAVDESPDADAGQPAGTDEEPAEDAVPRPEAGEPEQAASSEEAAPEEPEKFTQRLLADGSENDPGPAGEPDTIGEGTSTAAAVAPQDSTAPAAGSEEEGTETNQPAVAVGQRAFFYEERTSSAQGSAESGSIVWSLVNESPGGDLPAEPAIRAEATIPAKDLQLRMTIRRNGDETLPASHIIEMIFLTPDDFRGGGIQTVTRIAFKDSEQAPGNPLLGIPAKIADGYFLVALSDSPAEVEANMTLMGRQSWIDIPLVYQSGRRALITLEKGLPGDQVFEQALRAWTETRQTQDSAG